MGKVPQASCQGTILENLSAGSEQGKNLGKSKRWERTGENLGKSWEQTVPAGQPEGTQGERHTSKEERRENEGQGKGLSPNTWVWRLDFPYERRFYVKRGRSDLWWSKLTTATSPNSQSHNTKQQVQTPNRTIHGHRHALFFSISTSATVPSPQPIASEAEEFHSTYAQSVHKLY